jgi:hypothetical protein
MMKVGDPSREPDQFPVPDWHQKIVRELIATYRNNPIAYPLPRLRRRSSRRISARYPVAARTG